MTSPQGPDGQVPTDQPAAPGGPRQEPAASPATSTADPAAGSAGQDGGAGTVPAAGTAAPASSAAQGGGTAAASGAAPAGQRPVPPQHVVKRTRLSGLWVGLIISAVVLILLLIFILENEQKADIGYFGAHGNLPLGIALLLAALAGALLVLIPGTGRIIQLRRTARRHRKADAARLQAGGAPAPAAAEPPKRVV